MRTRIAAALFAILLTAPAYAGAQSPERIIAPEDLGTYGSGDYVIIYGTVSTVVPGASLVIQVSNPQGMMCNIQQFEPLSSGAFVSEAITLRGNLCGPDGKYEARMFYGEHTADSEFEVRGAGIRVLAGDDLFDAAKLVIQSKIEQARGYDTSSLSSRVESLVPSTSTIEDLRDAYVELLNDTFSVASLDGLDTTIRRPVSDALDEIDVLEGDAKLDSDEAASIEDVLFTAMFYYEIGDVRTAAANLNAAFASLRGADPAVPVAAPASFESLEKPLVSLLQKSGSILGKSVRDELAFILARGTAPLYADEIGVMLDLLTHARYLEITSRTDDPVYGLVSSEWAALQPLITTASSLEAVAGHAEAVARLYDAAFLLRDMDRVEEFVRSERGGQISELLRPAWNGLIERLSEAADTDQIIALGDDIRDLKEIVDISSRLTHVIRLSGANGVDTELTRQWPGLLDRISSASSLSEVRGIVAAFNESINELRESRYPLDELKLDYRRLRAEAEKQSDRLALANIDNALQVISLAERLAAGGQTAVTFDRIEVLLAWAIQKSSEIDERLSSYSTEDIRLRSADILTRAQSLEDLAEIGLRTKRFVPGYSDYVEEVLKSVSRTRELVIGGELKQADDIIRRAFDEWHTVAAAYRDDPNSGGDYGIVDVTRRVYQSHVDDLGSIAARFLEEGTDEKREFTRLLERATAFTDLGNFVDAQDWITQAYEYAQEHLNTEHNQVIYNIDYDTDIRSWIIHGFVDKQAFDNREDITVRVAHANGTSVGNLEFADTRHGEFSVDWSAPNDPGVYIAELLWRDTTSANIIYVPYPIDAEQERRAQELSSRGGDFVAISRDLFDLREFTRGFGGERYQAHVGKIAPLFDDADEAIDERDESEARAKVAEIRALIERYLPQRSPEAVIQTSYAAGTLSISGALKKSVEFSEDIYIDIFDQAGELVVTINMTDSPDGTFSRDLVRSFEPGTHAALLSYHDLRVSDFFTVGSG